MDIVERVARALCRERMQHSNEIFREFEPHRYKTQEVLERMIEDSWWFEVEQAKAAISASGVAELVEALEQIAAYYDTSANEHLKETGSYGCFDEPYSVEEARTALARYRGEA